MQPAQQNLRIQKWVTLVALVLFAAKILAYYLTGSVAILTDALESTVNVVASLIGLYSLYVAAKPRDTDHPYGHGKVEFISAAVEGVLIAMAGLIIIYEAIVNFIHPHSISRLDFGIILVAASALVNYLVGWLAIKTGKKNNSLALLASGKHLQSDTWSTLGIIAGLILILLTGRVWIDSVVAIIFGIIIIYTGYRIIRRSVAGIMDEADLALLVRMVAQLNSQRRSNWVDLHNLRVIKYGSVLHIDCHLTVPWYLNVHEAHREIDDLQAGIKNEFGEAVELFVHTDGCLPFSCSICAKTECPHREKPFEKKVEWTPKNIMQNSKHQLSDAGTETV